MQLPDCKDLQAALRYGGRRLNIVAFVDGIFASYVCFCAKGTGWGGHMCWWYDCERDAWTRVSPMPHAFEHSILPLGSRALAIGDGAVHSWQPGRRLRGCWCIHDGYEAHYDDDIELRTCVARRDGEKIYLIHAPEEALDEGGEPKFTCRVQCFTLAADGGAWEDMHDMPGMRTAVVVAVPAMRAVGDELWGLHETTAATPMI